jgi:hypothetical protein
VKIAMSCIDYFNWIRRPRLWRHDVIVRYLDYIFVLLHFWGVKLEVKVVRGCLCVAYFLPGFIKITIFDGSSLWNPFGERPVEDCDILDAESFKHPKRSRGWNFPNFVVNHYDITFSHID